MEALTLLCVQTGEVTPTTEADPSPNERPTHPILLYNSFLQRRTKHENLMICFTLGLKYLEPAQPLRGCVCMCGWDTLGNYLFVYVNMFWMQRTNIYVGYEEIGCYTVLADLFFIKTYTIKVYSACAKNKKNSFLMFGHTHTSYRDVEELMKKQKTETKHSLIYAL